MKPSIGNAPGAHVSTELLSSYVDSELTGEERLRVEQHLRMCATCRAELASLRQTVALLHALPRVAVPRPFTLSEAQVGVRRDAGSAWVWGFARALGAIAAIVVVAFLATRLLQQPGQWTPTQVAQAPAAAPAAAPSQAAAPSAAPLLAPQPAQPELSPQAQTGPAESPQTSLPSPQAAAKQAGAPTGAAAAQDQMQGQAATSAPAAAAEAASPTGSEAGSQPPAAPAPVSPSSTPGMLAMSPQATPAPGLPQQPMTLNAPATAVPGAPSMAFGRGGGGAAGGGGAEGGGAVGATGIAAAGTPVPLPPTAPLNEALPANAGVAYIYQQTLTAIDAHGTRPLAQAPGMAAPSISPDRTWVAYQVMQDGSNQVWAVRWDGSDAHLLIGGGNLPTPDLAGAGTIQIERLLWLPAGHTLGVVASIPGTTDTSEPRRELWTINPDNGAPHFVLELGMTDDISYSPDGRKLAVLRHGGPAQPGGRLTLMNADGSGQRTVLEFVANMHGYAYPTQLAWWPDSTGLWAAIPEPNATFPDAASIDLYRVPASGQAQAVDRIPALDTFWSPDAKHVAYTRAVDSTGTNRELILANSEGSEPKVYAKLSYGTILSWAPDNKHFVYADGEQLYLGGLGLKPQPLGSFATMLEPHWVGPGQLLYLLDQGPEWAVVTRTADGKTASLAMVPKEAMIALTGK